MKRLVIFFLLNFVAVVPQLYSISVKEYIKENGMPRIVGDFTGKYLDLSNKNLTDLTGLQDVDNIELVNYLNLRNNQLKVLPGDIFSGLDRLRVLDLSYNQLRELPSTIFDGLNLFFLRLRGNPFNPDFIPTLVNMIRSLRNLNRLDDKPKDQALREQPYSMLKGLTVEQIAKNIDAYRDRLHLLPVEILDLLPLTPVQRAAIAAEKRRIVQ